MTDPPVVNANIEVNSAYTTLVRGLEDAAVFAALGYQVASLDRMDLPERSVPLRFAASQETEPALSRAWGSFAQRCSGFAVIAMMAAFEGYVEYLEFVRRLSVEFVENGSLNLEAINRIRSEVSEHSQARVREVVSNLTPGDWDSSRAGVSRAWFHGLYDLRNCLAHRSGVVTRQDVRPPKNELTIRWLRSTVSTSGDAVAELPRTFKAAEQLEFRWTDEPRSWRLGQRVELTASDSQDIAYTLARFGAALAAEVINGIASLLSASDVESDAG